MNPTTDSQALLTKTFLNFTFFLFFFFFYPLSLVFAQQQLHTTFPYSLLLCPTNVQLPVNNLYSLYDSIYHSISFIYIMQGSKSHKHSHKAKNPKKKKKHKQFSSAATQAPNHQISSVTSVHQ